MQQVLPMLFYLCWPTPPSWIWPTLPGSWTWPPPGSWTWPTPPGSWTWPTPPAAGPDPPPLAGPDPPLPPWWLTHPSPPGGWPTPPPLTHPSPPWLTHPSPPVDKLTKWNYYLPHPSDAGGNKGKRRKINHTEWITDVGSVLFYVSWSVDSTCKETIAQELIHHSQSLSTRDWTTFMRIATFYSLIVIIFSGTEHLKIQLIKKHSCHFLKRIIQQHMKLIWINLWKK